MGGIAGGFSSFLLSRVSFAIPAKHVINFVKRGNTKGDAAVGLVLSRLGLSANRVEVLNGRGRSCLRGRGVNIIFSRYGFRSILGTGSVTRVLSKSCGA